MKARLLPLAAIGTALAINAAHASGVSDHHPGGRHDTSIVIDVAPDDAIDGDGTCAYSRDFGWYDINAFGEPEVCQPDVADDPIEQQIDQPYLEIQNRRHHIRIDRQN